MPTIGRLVAGALLVVGGMLTTTACEGADAERPPASLEVVEQGSLVVCAEIPYAPFVAEDGDGEPTGFEIELLERMASALELDLVVRPTAYAELDDGDALRLGRCDVAAGALAVTEERRRQMSFLRPHYDVRLTLLVPAASDVDGLADLGDRRLAVLQDSTAQSYARRQAPADVVLEPFVADQDMVQALREGRVDGVLQELPVNLVHTASGRFVVVETHRTGEQYSFAVRRDADRLRRALDVELAALRRDGDYRELYDSYFTAG